MMVEKIFTDEELVAYLDGEHDFAPSNAIDEALKTDKTLAERLDQLSIEKQAFVAEFASIVPQTKFEPKVVLPAANQNSISSWRNLAASVVILGIGFGVGMVSQNISQPGWKEYVAAYQALYTSSTLSSVSQTKEMLTSQLSHVSAAIGKDISPDQLQISEEVEYKRGQVLGFEGTPLIQLAFLTSGGEPLALCILRTGAQDTETPTLDKMEGMSSANWSKGGYSYLLIGGNDPELISRLAEKYIATSL